MQKLLGWLGKLSKKRKLLLGTAIILVVILIGAYEVWGTKKNGDKYVTNVVKKGNITTSISASGLIEPVDTVNVSFATSATVKKIYVKVGDHITKGELLAEEDSSDLAAGAVQAQASLKAAQAKLDSLKQGSSAEDIAQSRAGLKSAQVDYDQAQSDLNRYQQLFQAGAVAQSDLDTKKYAAENAEAKLEQAQASLQSVLKGSSAADIASAEADVDSCRSKLEVAQEDLDGAKMYSPASGVVSAVNGAEGQRYSSNSSGNSSSDSSSSGSSRSSGSSNSSSDSGLITIISSDLQIKADVNETDIGKLKMGQKAEFTVNSYPNKTYTGKVTSVAPDATTSSNVQVYEAYIQIDNQQGLKAGMPTNLNIIVSSRSNVLTIPKEAVTFAVSYISQLRRSNNGGNKSWSGNGTTGYRQGSANSSNRSSNGFSNQRSLSTQSAGNNQQRALVLVQNKSGKIVPTRVTLGISDLTNYEVVGGLKAGETIIVGSLAASTTSVTSQSNNSRQGFNNRQNGGSPFTMNQGGRSMGGGGGFRNRN